MASSSSAAHREPLVPTINFSMVCPGVYRSGYPTKKNYSFLCALRLRSILYLCPEDYAESNLKFCEENGIHVLRFPTEGNKEPFNDISEPLMHRILGALCDTRNLPLLIHCNKGKHRTGTVVACLRHLQGWSLVSIFEEYKRFASDKARVGDQQYVELYHPIVKLTPPFVAPWVSLTSRVTLVTSDRELMEAEAIQLGTSLLAPDKPAKKAVGGPPKASAVAPSGLPPPPSPSLQASPASAAAPPPPIGAVAQPSIAPGGGGGAAAAAAALLPATAGLAAAGGASSQVMSASLPPTPPPAGTKAQMATPNSTHTTASGLNAAAHPSAASASPSTATTTTTTTNVMMNTSAPVGDNSTSSGGGASAAAAAASNMHAATPLAASDLPTKGMSSTTSWHSPTAAPHSATFTAAPQAFASSSSGAAPREGSTGHMSTSSAGSHQSIPPLDKDMQL